MTKTLEQRFIDVLMAVHRHSYTESNLIATSVEDHNEGEGRQVVRFGSTGGLNHYEDYVVVYPAVDEKTFEIQIMDAERMIDAADEMVTKQKRAADLCKRKKELLAKEFSPEELELIGD
ncbi:MAG: hypothetical protein WC284_18665 [Candidimonas sp.]